MTSTCAWLDRCGGCDLGDMTLPDQHARKAAFAQRTFALDEPPPLIPSPRSTAHRARIKLAIAGAAVGYRPPKSHDLVDVEVCSVAREEVQAAHSRLRDWLDEMRALKLRSVEIRSDGERAVYNFEMASKAVPARVRSALFELEHVALNGRRLCGDPTLELEVLGHRLRASPKSFYQVNLEANLLLADHVRSAVSALQPTRVLDLYSGIGNLTFPLAGLGVPVLAVEREGQATNDLKERIGEHDVRVLTLDVGKFDPSREFFDVAVLDPPRVGAPGVVDRLVLNRPTGIVYVSCHAPSAARDLKAAKAAGYAVSDVTCFDLFPDTHHVETVVVLERQT